MRDINIDRLRDDDYVGPIDDRDPIVRCEVLRRDTLEFINFHLALLNNNIKDTFSDLRKRIDESSNADDLIPSMLQSISDLEDDIEDATDGMKKYLQYFRSDLQNI